MSLYQGFMDNDFLFWLFMSGDNLYSCLMDIYTWVDILMEAKFKCER